MWMRWEQEKPASSLRPHECLPWRIIVHVPGVPLVGDELSLAQILSHAMGSLAIFSSLGFLHLISEDQLKVGQLVLEAFLYGVTAIAGEPRCPVGRRWKALKQEAQGGTIDAVDAHGGGNARRSPSPA